jgi:translation initiation factor IF-1
MWPGNHDQDHDRSDRTVFSSCRAGCITWTSTGRRITAHIGGGSERNFVRVLVGDRVAIELTPRDLTRGRIVRKL